MSENKAVKAHILVKFFDNDHDKEDEVRALVQTKELVRRDEEGEEVAHIHIDEEI